MIAGRYELVERFGRGGMGEVWTCRDRGLDKDHLYRHAGQRWHPEIGYLDGAI